MDKNNVILCGAGTSVKEGLDLDLWNQIKGKGDIWSINFAFMTVPYLPTREIWVDYNFFKNNIDALQDLSHKGVEMIAKANPKYAGIPMINSYNTTRERAKYAGKEGIEKNLMFVGTQGLSGVFALSIAVAMGYKNIFLLGFDYGIPFNASDKTFTHYYQKELNVNSSGFKHPENYLTNDLQTVKKDVADFEVYLKETDVKIWNVSLGSHIPYFDKISYLTFFEILK